MLNLLTCLATEHDLRLVLVAAAVCLGGSLTTLRLFSRLRGSRGGARAVWLTLIGFVAGGSVWATHFIGMLAFSPGIRTGFAPVGTLASLLIAGLFMTAAFAVAARRGLGARIAGGVLIGAGIGAMHFAGMGAYEIQGRISWRPDLIVTALALGLGFGVAALCAAGRAATLARQAGAGLLLTLAIVSLHFTAMAAVTITPDLSLTAPTVGLAPASLAAATAAVVSLIILGGLAVGIVETSANARATARIRRLVDAAHEGIAVVQRNVIVDANAAFCALAGQPIEELIGQILEGGLLTLETESEGPETRREGLLQPQGDRAAIPVEVLGRALETRAGDEEGDLRVVAVRDLRERHAAEARIRHMAEHDGLTGLFNRAALQTRLSHALERAEATGESLTVFCLDLDQFKEANDTHGHAAGDAILIEVARRLEALVPAPSFAARLGGDEFVVVQIGGRQPRDAIRLCHDLIAAMAEPVRFEDHTHAVGASIGVSLFPEDGATATALLANADLALYRAKAAGRGGYRFFKREMDDRVRERRLLARDLRAAISAGDLVVHYQPQARTEDREVLGFEALVRWSHPERGLIQPGDFISIAEESGLIVPLGEWVLGAACAAAAAWAKPLRIAINLSPVQLHQPDLPDLVRETLVRTGLSPRRLELEITESALFKDYQRALDNLRRLKALGVRIAMDDFGTGFSSLSTLQSFPFDKIKIDKSFVENIDRDDRAKVIVRAILGLGRSLEIPVTAEGVETEDQIAFLRAEACAEIQGFAVGRPAPVETLGDWINTAAAPPKGRRARAA
ncbi:EAL domain-containing protein [Phenylobacterium aquaticum]|uniref:bifunctional diguanylate cyclase/phosphodiesterase n=1 Tax=Phenylobacterium aquaticum TaxID=1763816 RepID=UPI0034CF4939